MGEVELVVTNQSEIKDDRVQCLASNLGFTFEIYGKVLWSQNSDLTIKAF